MMVTTEILVILAITGFLIGLFIGDAIGDYLYERSHHNPPGDNHSLDPCLPLPLEPTTDRTSEPEMESRRAGRWCRRNLTGTLPEDLSPMPSPDSGSDFLRSSVDE